MSTQGYTSSLKSLSDSNKDILSRITRLSKLAPDLGSPSQDSQDRTELGDEIHSNLKELESEFELFKQESEDFVSPSGGAGHRKASTDKERERVALITQVERFGEDLKHSRTLFRRAQLQAKRNEEDAQRKAREQLFSSTNAESGERRAGSKRRGRDDNRSKDELALSAAGEVTAGLRRLHQHLNDSLGRNAYAKEILENSTAALRELDETYSSVVEQGLQTAKGLVSTLISSQKSDTWYLESALWVLFGTIAWLIFRRLFYGPLLYFVYKPSRLMLGIVYSALNFTLSLLTGTIFTSGGDVAQSLPTTRTRAPLIVKPSAGRGQNEKRQGDERPTIKVGLGGGGSAEGRNPSEKHQEEQALLEEIGKMTDQAKSAEKNMGEAEQIRHEGAGASGDSNTVRGDGTVLRERTAGEKPNPKKRMMEAPPPPGDEQAKGEEVRHAKDEL